MSKRLRSEVSGYTATQRPSKPSNADYVQEMASFQTGTVILQATFPDCFTESHIKDAINNKIGQLCKQITQIEVNYNTRTLLGNLVVVSQVLVSTQRRYVNNFKGINLHHQNARTKDPTSPLKFFEANNFTGYKLATWVYIDTFPKLDITYQFLCNMMPESLRNPTALNFYFPPVSNPTSMIVEVLIANKTQLTKLLNCGSPLHFVPTVKPTKFQLLSVPRNSDESRNRQIAIQQFKAAQDQAELEREEQRLLIRNAMSSINQEHSEHDGLHSNENQEIFNDNHSPSGPVQHDARLADFFPSATSIDRTTFAPNEGLTEDDIARIMYLQQ